VRQIFSEPHSTRQIEEGIAWANDTTGPVLAKTVEARTVKPEFDLGEAMYRKIHCPVLVLHGDGDQIQPYPRGKLVADITGAELVTFPGGGHNVLGRYPAKCNAVISDFLDRRPGVSSARKPAVRAGTAKRVLYLSSPIGLGHGRRDIAITRELRKLYPDLQVDWLSQDPVTRLLEANEETIHPLSARLASESRHIELESGEHDLNAFQALRRMDEVLIANFMIFQDAVDDGNYDLIIADEAWDIDHYWHEHPELKKAALAWFTDFVGFLPMPAGGEHEAFLTGDYNAEMIEHIERHPGVRDRAIFVGEPDDIIPRSFGKDLPAMRDWVPKHFDFAGYILGEHPASFGIRSDLRQALNYRYDERVCIVTVGGSGVGTHLIRRILHSWPMAKAAIPELRMIVVAGPRIDPLSLQVPAGVEVRAFVPNLDRHLAACDLALVQGGLTTCMELVAAGTPFIYFPLRNHFEQNFHVAHRLDRYRAGRRMEFATSTPEMIADAMIAELSAPKRFAPVEAGGAARAARMLANLI
jgi:predicted glycosyltransferase